MKHNKNNLVVLCEEHHCDVHNNKIIREKYKQTLKGDNILKDKESNIQKQKKYSKYSEYIITKFKEDYSNKQISLKNIKISIQIEKEITISEGIIKKILLNELFLVHHFQLNIFYIYNLFLFI